MSVSIKLKIINLLFGPSAPFHAKILKRTCKYICSVSYMSTLYPGKYGTKWKAIDQTNLDMSILELTLIKLYKLIPSMY